MARNDGIDRTVARNQDLETPADVAKVQEHNEREKDSYSNQDIVPERSALNVHFKTPTDDYVKMFEQMEQDGVISTRGVPFPPRYPPARWEALDSLPVSPSRQNRQKKG